MTIRQTIISDKDVADLIVKIKDFPRRIAEAKDRFETVQYELSVNNSVEALEEKVKDIRAEVEFEVALLTDESGKKVYGNEKARDNAARAQLLKNPDYVAAVNALANAKRDEALMKMNVGKAKVQLDYLYNEHNAYRTIAELVAGLCREDQTNMAFEKLQQRYSGAEVK